jgi:DNA-binding GntR family transcriptional regulator
MADATTDVRSDFSVTPLVRDTMQERVYRQVSDLILDGEIAPGQVVTIQSLADAFGVSTMPVREALKRLTAANALTFVTGRAMGVPRLDRDRLIDLRNVRVEMEGTAVRWAAERIDETTLEEVRRIFTAMDKAIAAGDVKGFLRGNRAYHFTIYRASGSPVLVNVIETLWLQISPYFNLLRSSGHYVSSNVRHRTLLRGLTDHDPATAARALTDDIDGAFDVLRGLLA